jgi:hypothetical protein
MQPGIATAAVGLQTSLDLRFVRFRWELPAPMRKGRWFRFSKGGDYSPFYYDFDLLVFYEDDGQALKEYASTTPGTTHWSRNIRNPDLYLRPGLTWPRRTQRGFNVRVMPEGCIFADKGPAIFPKDATDTDYLLGILNSSLAEYLCRALMSFGSYEVGVIQKLPIARPEAELKTRIGVLARGIHDAKADWDEGNETSTRFKEPWLLTWSNGPTNELLAVALEKVLAVEVLSDSAIQKAYGELDVAVFDAYGLSQETRETVLRDLGERPPELVWPQMEGKTVEQKRMEHVWRLLSYAVKRAVEADEDGIVPFTALSGEQALLDRVQRELAALFPGREASQVEAEIANELKMKVTGYKRADSIREWLENVFFAYHVSLYKNRPIFWHIASSQGGAPSAFGVLVHYHRFDKNRMARLRSMYLREAMDNFRREAALADKEGRADERVEWQAKLEEAQDLDRRLRWVQEGHHEGPEGGNKDYRILTPWKKPHERPKGWDPDLDDGVKVNIEPLQKAGVLRIAKVA